MFQFSVFPKQTPLVYERILSLRLPDQKLNKFRPDGCAGPRQVSLEENLRIGPQNLGEDIFSHRGKPGGDTGQSRSNLTSYAEELHYLGKGCPLGPQVMRGQKLGEALVSPPELKTRSREEATLDHFPPVEGPDGKSSSAHRLTI